MLMPRRTLRRFAVWLLLPLLFAQWAAATYACPQAAASKAVAMPDMPGCHGNAPGTAMDPDQPLLCKAHCDRGAQSVNDSPSDEPSPQLLLWAVLDWNASALKPVHSAAPAVESSASPSPASSPPLYLLLRVLRN